MLTVTFDTTNDAFEQDPRGEVARILRNIATAVESGDEGYYAVLDLNGNTIGRWTLSRSQQVER